jgi:hypothetical protein
MLLFPIPYLASFALPSTISQNSILQSFTSVCHARHVPFHSIPFHYHPIHSSHLISPRLASPPSASLTYWLDSEFIIQLATHRDSFALNHNI